jgi:hypothetical protein
MPRLSLYLTTLLSLPLSAIALAAPAVHPLDNGVVRAEVTEHMGGRLLSFGLAGQPNFLKVDLKAGDPTKPVNARTANIGYLGHETWIGPQSQWWAHQNANPRKAAAKADWPPDPYLSLAKYRLETSSSKEVAFTSPASPVNGLQVRKRYALVEGQPNSLRVDVSATNVRKKPVAWDIWFNTRTHADTLVYVPVASSADVRTGSIAGVKSAPLVYTLADGIFSLDLLPPPPGETRRNGKFFLQPSHGWMAGFHGSQAFIIQFAHQARSAIHPEQGQVELYNDYPAADLSQGLMEMEVHAPYRQLASGASMEASEQWTILPYSGPATRAAHLAFLREHAVRLGLKGL